MIGQGSVGETWQNQYFDVMTMLTDMRIRAAARAWESDAMAFLNSITLPSPGSGYGSGGGGGGWAMYVPPYKDPFMVRPLPATKNNNKVTTPRPDDDGYLTFEEAVAWYRGGSGQKLTVSIRSLGLYNIYAEDFKGIGDVKDFSLFNHSASWNSMFVFGTIKLKLYPGNEVRAFWDTFNFEMHLWNTPDECLRNIETLVGGLYVGVGTPYEVEITGGIKILSHRLNYRHK